MFKIAHDQALLLRERMIGRTDDTHLILAKLSRDELGM
ncbi:Uncharacterised protein [Vibrio cholerae]|nr:Uncharacterised protein [Vibrio cholerae]